MLDKRYCGLSTALAISILTTSSRTPRSGASGSWAWRPRTDGPSRYSCELASMVLRSIE